MLEFETLVGRRVVASTEVIDDALAPASGSIDRGLVLRFAPDDALLLPDEGTGHFDIQDPDAIVVDETGFAGCWITPEELAAHVLPRIEWPLPVERPALLQGSVAGVPAKLWLTDDRSLLLCAAPYADELRERLR